MEEKHIYVADLGNVPEEDDDYLKARSCALLINVGHESYEGEKFKATTKLLNLRFKECVIVAADTLQKD